MIEITTYIAYDGTEFDDREDCEFYESQAFDYLEEIFNSVEFYKKNKQEIQIFLNDVESGLKAFTYAFDACEYIRIKKEISNEADIFLFRELGFDIPFEKGVGLYKYNFGGGNWFKVDE